MPNSTGFKIKGHTLIELMVIFSIIGIMFSIATPLFSVQISKQQTKQSALATLSALTVCRSQAITSMIDVDCQIESSPTTLTASLLVDVDGNGSKEKMAESKLNISSLTETNFTNSTLIFTFNRYGFLTSAPPFSNLKFCDSKDLGKHYEIGLDREIFLKFSEVSSARVIPPFLTGV